MELWIIEPHDPLIVRDGRPFGPTPGARARPLDFPFPSTIAGGLRTRAGQEPNGVFNKENIEAVKQISVRGPLLVELDEEDKPEFLVPAPRDALLLKNDKDEDEDEDEKVFRHRLRPLQMDDALANMPDDLPPVGLPQPDLRKPYKDAPRFWYWKDTFVQWLTSPTDKVEEVNPTALGHDGPGKEWRIHVKIDPRSFTGEEGALFATGGLVFWQRPSNEAHKLSPVRRLALAAAVENLNGLNIEEAFAPLGGERRMMRWHQGKTLPKLPEGLAAAIAEKGYCRLILLTPACFQDGWKPDWLLQARYGVTPELKAAVVGKPQTVSGWDFEKRGPKPTRRLVPAGSVYYLYLGDDAAAAEEWVKAMWLQNVSDDEADRLAGFGLAAIGIWDGVPAAMTGKEVQ